MKRSNIGLVGVAAVLTVLILLISRTVFPPTDNPPNGILPLFIFFGFWDALAFGIGIAILIYVALHFSRWPKEIRKPIWLMFFLASWFSVLNWVHDGMHESGAAAPNWQYLALTEIIFHVPWLLFAVGLVFAARTIIRAKQ